MFHTKDHKTLDMFDPLDFLGPKRRKLIDGSWAKLFREEILPALPVHILTEHYHAVNGRPSKELHAMLGLMILQQMHDLADEEAIEQFAFNIQWHYALNISGESDAATYICPKTLWNMRSILSEHGLYNLLFESVTDKLAKLFSVDTNHQRLDSTHIFSNMRHLGRIGLFTKTIKGFLVNLKRHNKELFSSLDTTLTDRYFSKEKEAVFSMVKPSESSKTLETLGNDLFTLIERFKNNVDVIGMSKYKLMVRLLSEQCIVEEDENKAKKVVFKANKDVPSDSLQNPSDPDAGYDGHKGQGYQAQISENYSKNDEQEELSLITYVEVEPAHESDANALLPAIESTHERGLGPEEMLADTAYGGDDNCEKAKEIGVEVISPVSGKVKNDCITLADFELSNEGTVTACCQGHKPVEIKQRKDKHVAVFDSNICSACSCQDACPVTVGKKAHYLRYDNKAIRLANRRCYEKTPESKDKYRYRAGVEATMSQCKAKTGLRRLRVRGLKAVSFCVFLKAAGINILRATAFKKQTERKNIPPKGTQSGLLCYISVVKEQSEYMLNTCRKFLGRICDFGQMTREIAR